MDIEFKDNELIYKGIPTSITREDIFDFQNRGMDPMYYIEKMYNESIVIIRDTKIDLILGK